MEDKKEKAKQSFLMKILSFSPARDAAKKAKPEPYLSNEKKNKFKTIRKIRD